MRGLPRLLWACVAVAFLARAAYSWLFPQWGPGGSLPDPDGYTGLALGVLERGGLYRYGLPSAAREPVYPVFLAAVFAVRRSYRLVQAAQCLLGAASVAMAYRLARRPFGERAALAAAAMMAVYPQHIYYASLILRETWLVFVVLAALLALAWVDEQPSWRRAAAAGLAGGLAALSNSTFLPWAVAGAPAGLWWTLGRGRRALLLSACYALASGALYSTWVIRNYVQLGRFVPGSSAAVGSSFYTHLVVPDELAGTPEQTRLTDADPVVRAAEGRGFDDVARERYFLKASFERVGRAPAAYLGLCARRFLKLWRLVPYNRDYAHGYRLIRLASLLSDAWMIPLALGGALLAGFSRPEAVQLWLMTLSSSAVYAAIWAMVRYRMPMMTAVFVFAGVALCALYENLVPNRVR